MSKLTKKGFVALSTILPIIIINTLVTALTSAIIVEDSSTHIVPEANFASFSVEMDDYRSAVMLSAVSCKASGAVEGLILNDMQLYYMVANGIRASQLRQYNDDFDEEAYNNVFGKIIPEGYQMPDEILRSLEYTPADKDWIAVYEIKNDSYVDGYREDFELYGDKNGTEKHYVTSDGTVFTLPGFPREQPDGEIRYYITPTSYYVVKGENTTITPEDTGYTLVNSPIQGDDLTVQIGISIAEGRF